MAEDDGQDLAPGLEGIVPPGGGSAAGGIGEMRMASLVVGTAIGGVWSLLPISGAEYDLLRAAEGRVAEHPATAPLGGGGHGAYRGKRGEARGVIDGELLLQLLEMPEGLCADVLSEGLEPRAVVAALERALWGWA